MTKRVYNSDSGSEVGKSRDSDTIGSPAKIQELDMSSDVNDDAPPITCSLPPHEQLKFGTIDEFDIHYAKEHTNRCTSCSKNFPSAHFLNLHLEENHNPLREELAAKGEKTYGCFIEGCDKKCLTPQKRRRHLIDKHMFPPSYNFRVVDKGIDRSISLLQGGQKRRVSAASHTRRRSSAAITSGGPTPMVKDNQLRDTDKTQKTPSEKALVAGAATKEVSDIGELEKSMAALNFVPPSVLARQRPKKSDK